MIKYLILAAILATPAAFASDNTWDFEVTVGAGSYPGVNVDWSAVSGTGHYDFEYWPTSNTDGYSSWSVTDNTGSTSEAQIPGGYLQAGESYIVRVTADKLSSTVTTGYFMIRVDPGAAYHLSLPQF